ncbi:Putative SCF-ubiquitin ligase F-box protein [Komagataella phaffii CBS 7435]|uniref:SCF-ubiquitin ligase F-box protein n=2 Tax=Komagataella phaffii TaxID=460519 RepID=C4R4A8_KOMPG|nr:Putative SCF-ubiquitin ligase F-box protein [Komagataella phaffii GS115]AOA64070.1 GQ67_03415T0 [Komagataella phaffii]CAH2449855.1 Putative SCF-ubiquitin ligase F-box protein [Komagataella phaffii CBS 7435]AOA69129.1 GQ68_03384T0 [Komagataella phaffii GS115]CAY70394.1 Putative SCF-ubiquitin ligase F-box protein [Komagataella phaffii GS115]CCA39814.1 Putative SCF-ubiquitin ligase F-box protein [Komagataella phaffii CBS 7435]
MTLDSQLQTLSIKSDGAVDLSKLDDKQRRAYDLFHQANEKEMEGAMSDAVELYRKAYKLDEKVDRWYRYQDITKQASPHNKNTIEKPAVDLELVKKINVQELLNSFNEDQITPEEENEPSPLHLLSDDLLIYIMELLCDADSSSWFYFAITCKKLSYLGFHNKSIWEKLCKIVYSRQRYDEDTPCSQDQICQNTWKGDWHLMLSQRPFLKFNGAYISIINYYREGGRPDMSNSWSNPIRCVTYYRFVRFYPDGTCQRLLTFLSPKIVVPRLNKNYHELGLENVFRGTWKMTMDGQVLITGEGSVEGYSFSETLQIKNLGRMKHHKLHWISAYFQNKDDGEMKHFSLAKERPFTFSRVKSYSV